MLAELGDEAKVVAGGQSLVPLHELPPGGPRAPGGRQRHRRPRRHGPWTTGRSRWAPRSASPPAARPGRGRGPPAAGRGDRVDRPPGDPQPGHRVRLAGPRRPGGRAAGGAGAAGRLGGGGGLAGGPAGHPAGAGRRPVRRAAGDQPGVDELVVAARFPLLPPGTGWAVDELARRQGDYALAGRGPHRHGRRRRGAGGGPGRLPVVRARPRWWSTWRRGGGRGGDVYDLVAGALDPTDDIHATGAYRRHLAATLTARAVDRALRPGPGERRRSRGRPPSRADPRGGADRERRRPGRPGSRPGGCCPTCCATTCG